jgi:hypothetical protein
MRRAYLFGSDVLLLMLLLVVVSFVKTHRNEWLRLYYELTFGAEFRGSKRGF